MGRHIKNYKDRFVYLSREGPISDQLMKEQETIAILGAGIAGVATAYYIGQTKPGVKVVLIDKNLPLSYTTSKSGENYRNYWPQQCMQQFIGHSIDLMEALRVRYGSNAFEMNQSGYNFITHTADKYIFGIQKTKGDKDTIQEITDAATIKKEFPYLDKGIQKVVSLKNAGKIDVQALGNLLHREAKKRGTRFIEGEVLTIDCKGSTFHIVLDTKSDLTVDKLVIAAGPFMNHIAAMLGMRFPITNTLQHKFIIPDPKKIIPRDMPFTIYTDAQYVNWPEEEKAFFTADEKWHWLLQEFPGGLHIKPDGHGIKLGWAFERADAVPTWEIPKSDIFPQVVLRGASRFIPQLGEYAETIPSPLIQYGGFYTRTKENWPLIGPTELSNVYLVGALSGFGTMGACAAGELCADHMYGKKALPGYAAHFHPSRYNDDTIIRILRGVNSDGQL
ncbi:MAG: FAD-binding oxidoreductase [Maribacter sp.]|nr:FAD-binding oxidoreductase [Maribacter sp.]